MAKSLRVFLLLLTMTESQVNSWILLAIALATKESPAKINAISDIADGINHAVPTQKELQTSIRWLINNQLIIKKGKYYNITENGSNLMSKAETNSEYLSGIWKALEQEVLSL